MPRECDFFLEIFELKIFQKFLYHYDDALIYDESAYLRFVLVTIFIS